MLHGAPPCELHSTLILSSPRGWSMMVPHTTMIRYRPSTSSSPGREGASQLMRESSLSGGVSYGPPWPGLAGNDRAVLWAALRVCVAEPRTISRHCHDPRTAHAE